MKHIFVGMSGGIDSSAAALLLTRQGYRVTGVTFTALKEEGTQKCCSIEEITAARQVCLALGIPHKTVDLKDIFEARIIKSFIDTYRAGRTPNPCILCNRFIKFGALLEYALTEGADAFATGHYARISEQAGRLYITRGADSAKDQSYFLSNIEPEKLPFIMLPLGDYTKPQVRGLIAASNLPIAASKAESQDICFVADDYRDFLSARGVPETPGPLIAEGRQVGTHRGIPFYSLGQRRGLGVAMGERVFVRAIDAAANTVTLGAKPLVESFTVEPLNCFDETFINGPYTVQTRYRARTVPAEASLDGGILTVTPAQPLDMTAPGQFAVLYRGDTVAASGPISTIRLKN